MRKSIIASLVLHILAGTIAVLGLLWCFVPGGNLIKGLATLVVVFFACRLMWTGGHRLSAMPDSATLAAELPAMDTQSPVVLVCGDNMETLFLGKILRKTSQGWWLRIDDVDQLAESVRDIQEQQPSLAGQLAVMYVCCPDLYTDEAEMRASLKSFREQAGKLVTLLGFSPPVFVSCEFSGPQTPWVIIRDDKPVVCVENSPPVALADWQQVEEHLALIPLLKQSVTFISETVMDELDKSDRLYPPVKTFAVALRTGFIQATPQSLWARWLYSLSCLRFSGAACNTDPVSRYPDAILPFLAPFATPLRGGQRARHLVFLLWFCALAAIGFSAANNQGLIHQISAHLQRWYAIPMEHYSPKARSLADLKRDVLLLERWQRQGEPWRYGLGYYPGQRLWLALSQAIDTYRPPQAPAPKAESPKIVRLDSMSLFDSGKSELKAGSTKMLVTSLVGIKAKPGWLIVVSGHTDDTGSEQLNQILSLKRAEAVRNWMRDTGDVPESCFAVQGYGDSRPVASNGTPEGRALNRRVEISLVPQANACRIPGITPSSSQDGDGFEH
ncbi:OmpA family protein [Salmonella enterica]